MKLDQSDVATFDSEIKGGTRFEFGKNWSKYIDTVNEERISTASASLLSMLGIDTLRGLTFLDVGCGSGLFSLAATRLGARVTSFDYDPASVTCAIELKRRFYGADDSWRILHGSVLDVDFLKTLGEFDIVYSWGVLHHTGNQGLALRNVDYCVKKGGLLFIALYNYQRFISSYWAVVKRLYNRSIFFRAPILLLHTIYPTIPSLALRAIQKRKYPRGMSFKYDLYDWLGGYPFEVSKPEQIFRYYRDLNYSLKNLVTVGGALGCNEYVFEKNA